MEQLPAPTFDALDPENPITSRPVRIAKGQLFEVFCPDCDSFLGGGIDGPDNPLGAELCSRYSTSNPCVFCGKGPGVLRYIDLEFV